MRPCERSPQAWGTAGVAARGPWSDGGQPLVLACRRRPLGRLSVCSPWTPGLGAVGSTTPALPSAGPGAGRLVPWVQISPSGQDEGAAGLALPTWSCAGGSPAEPGPRAVGPLEPGLSAPSSAGLPAQTRLEACSVSARRPQRPLRRSVGHCPQATGTRLAVPVQGLHMPSQPPR